MLDRNLAFATAQRKIRCAIYTRKSTEEGLEQDFNSLHAQREACEAYIASQKHEGWVLLPQAYDDGGISGVTLDRPGVQQLLADVDAGLVDQIVVYKVDRLTRSLTDFGKLVERLDAVGASFVSVTQSFNTATSMGRLTLNMLLSFAQFEREVTAERIRDKIAASKAKGLWMGGNIPFGYDKDGRSLKIREDEAGHVRFIFNSYAQGEAVADLVETCNRKGILTRRRTNNSGEIKGGKPFARGHLYEMLSNPIYVGHIRHKGKTYEGQHKGIIDQELWGQVQIKLTEGRQGHGRRLHNSKAKDRMPLLGFLKDKEGAEFVANHSKVKGRRLDYYVSANSDKDTQTLRYGAKMLEQVIASPSIRSLTPLLINEDSDLKLTSDQPKSWLPYVKNIRIEPGLIKVQFNPERIDLKELKIPFTMRRQKKELRMCIEGEGTGLDETLLENLAKARALYEETKRGADLKSAAERLNINPEWARKLLPLAFVSPSLIERTLKGDLPSQSTSSWFAKTKLPVKFADQKQLVDALE